MKRTAISTNDAEIQTLRFCIGDQMNTNTVVGLFDYYSNADKAVQALKDYGVDGNRISIVARDNDTLPQESSVVTGATAGAATGAATGGLLGLMAGLSALIIPGIGPVIATGTLASALATALGMTAIGAGVGAATGGLLGVLVDLGFPPEDAEFYTEGVKRGGILVTVQTNPEEAEEISEILRGAGAVDRETRRQTWQNDGWSSSDDESTTDEITTTDEEIETFDEESYRR
jgi:hypothetical protein